MTGPTVFMPFPDGIYAFNVPISSDEKPFEEFREMTPVKPGHVRIAEILTDKKGEVVS
jgi:hypothetical protein